MIYLITIDVIKLLTSIPNLKCIISVCLIRHNYFSVQMIYFVDVFIEKMNPLRRNISKENNLFLGDDTE